MGRAATSTDRLSVWRDLIRDDFVALDIDVDARDEFAGRVRSADVGRLNVAVVESRTQGCTRTPRLARADDDAYLQVGMLGRGAASVEQDGRAAVLAPGDFAIYETDRPFRWNLRGGWELLVFTWPRATVRVRDAESQTLTARCLQGDGGVSALVGRMLRDLALAPPELSPAGALRLGDEVAELVTTVAAEQSRGPRHDAQTDLLAAIDGYIDERLGDPLLDPAAIAAAHYISTRHLHRLFAGRDTTVAHRVQHLRLDRAYDELCAPGCDRLSITEISQRWGFADLASFSRAFRSRFGTTPTQCRARRGADRP